MSAGVKKSSKTIPRGPWQGVSTHWRVLFICDRQRTGAWLLESLAAESHAEIEIHEVTGSNRGLARLRDEVFDVVFIAHAPPELDALDLVAAYRTGGTDDPLIVVGRESEQELAVPSFEAGADHYICVSTATSPLVTWAAVRAVQRSQLLRQNRRLQQGERQRLQKEREEAFRVLEHERSLLGEKQHTTPSAASRTGSSPSQVGQVKEVTTDSALLNPPDLPAKLISHYRELLRAYIIMGTGHLGAEIRHLAEVFSTAGLSTKEVMHLHTYITGQIISGLGSRSTRHVITRANLLVIEMLFELAEAYRKRYRDATRPSFQLYFPQFDRSPNHAKKLEQPDGKPCSQSHDDEN